jgi:Leucine-rich repeat (LRR) protein
LPPEIGNLTSLTELNLSNNRQAALPPEMKKLLDE